MAEAELFAELQEFLTGRGAGVVACGDLRCLPRYMRENLPRGISIGVALDRSVVGGIADGPTRAYVAEYQRVNALLNCLAEDGARLLRGCGFHAVPGKATVVKLDQETLATPLPHKTVAALAGVGWIGKCALLINETYGSAVRYNTVLTDAPLPLGTPVTALRCGDCTACVDACPGGAPSGRPWEPRLNRADFFDAFACWREAQRQARKAATQEAICGICIAACPYTKRYFDGIPPVAGRP